MHILRLLSILACIGIAPSRAALAWQTTRIEAKTEPGQERFEALFPFKNTSDTTVTITSTETSCGCTVARLAKFTYAPGETGVLRAVFEFGERVGPQQKVVTVATNDGAAATHLVLRIDIPEVLALDRETLQWVVGAAAEVQRVNVRALPGVTFKELEFDPHMVRAEIATNPTGEAAVTVTPLSTAKAFRQVIRLHAEFAGKRRVIPFYVSVR
jgi:hypothetical protein